MLPLPCGSSQPCPVLPSPSVSCLSSQASRRSVPPGPCLRTASLGLVVYVRLRVLLPPLPLVYSFGFFSLNSIAYRRVIRVYQYEVGDDLSGRFFSSYFSSCLTVVLPMHS